MAIINKTTQPFDAEITLQSGSAYPSLSAQTTIFKNWQNTFVTENPIAAQVAFFKDLASKVSDGTLSTEFYQYWYDLQRAAHPVVVSSISAAAVPEFKPINESVGTLWYAQPDSATTNINALAGTPLKPYPSNIQSLLPSGVKDIIDAAYKTTNSIFATNVANIQTDSSAAPTTAHGVSLVKDTIANTRNTQSKTEIQTKLEDKYAKALDLVEIKNTFSGDINTQLDNFTDTVENITISVDALTNKIEPTLSTIKTVSLQAQ